MSRKSTANEDLILGNLSAPLKEEVFTVTRGNLLRKCPLFKNYTNDFIRILIRSFSHTLFAPKDIIIKENDTSDSVYFIIKGRIEMFHQKTQTVFKELNEDRYFGEIAFFLKKPRVCSARSLIFSAALYITRAEMIDILKKRPKDMEYHKIFVLQAQMNLSLLSVKCYLCQKFGHIAKDCQEFVIKIDKDVFIEKSDNKRYKLHKKVKPINVEMSNIENSLKRYSKMSIQGVQFDATAKYKIIEGLNIKSKQYLKETLKYDNRYILNRDIRQIQESEESEYRNNSLLCTAQQYTKKFLIEKKKKSIDASSSSVVSRNVEWEDENEVVTFGMQLKSNPTENNEELFNKRK